MFSFFLDFAICLVKLESANANVMQFSVYILIILWIGWDYCLFVPVAATLARFESRLNDQYSTIYPQCPNQGSISIMK